jgi:hypothetical protein
MKDVPLEHVLHQQPGWLDDRFPHRFEQIGEPVCHLRRSELSLDFRLESCASGEDVLDLGPRSSCRRGAYLLELTLDVPERRFRRCQETGKEGICAHQDEQRAKVVFPFEPAPREVVTAQPGAGRAAPEDVWQRHRA